MSSANVRSPRLNLNSSNFIVSFTCYYRTESTIFLEPIHPVTTINWRALSGETSPFSLSRKRPARVTLHPFYKKNQETEQLQSDNTQIGTMTIGNPLQKYQPSKTDRTDSRSEAPQRGWYCWGCHLSSSRGEHPRFNTRYIWPSCSRPAIKM